MDYLLPFRGMIGGRVHWRPLTRHDLVRARALGADVLDDWRRGDAAHMRRVSANLAASGVVPLLGCTLLGWQADLAGIAIAIDIAALWWCDLLKVLFGREQMQYQIDWREKAHQVVHVARALFSRPRLYRDAGGEPPRPRLLYAEFSPNYDRIAPLMLAASFLVAATAVGLTFLFLMFSVVHPADAPLPQARTWALLLLPVVPRLASVRRGMRHARDARGAQSQPGLRSFLPACTLIVSLLGFIVVAGNALTRLPADKGLSFIAFYGLAALVIALLARRYMLHNMRTIERLSRGDLAAQAARLARYNSPTARSV